jgi:hypothetical protein
MAETPRKAVLEPCSRALEWSLATSLSSPSRTSAVGQHGWSNNASAALIPQNAFLSSRRRRSAIGCVIWDNFDKRAQAYIVVSMAPNVLYQIPYATWSVRLVMGVVASLFALAIFGWWLPRAIRLLRNLPAASGGQKIILVMVAVIPVAIGIGPLTVLFALIRNPVAYVTDTGVAQERVFHRTPVSLAWGEIAHVYCRLASDGRVTTISLVATDGRRIEFGNTGGVDFESMHELFANQLGPSVVRRCSTSLRS